MATRPLCRRSRGWRLVRNAIQLNLAFSDAGKMSYAVKPTLNRCVGRDKAGLYQ
jgi:hypothetical protein